MAIQYRIAIREAAKRLNAITGATASAMSTNYMTSPLTTTQLDDPVYSIDALKDVVLDVEGRIIAEIASAVDPVTGIGNHNWRPYFQTSTDVLYHGSSYPTIASNTLPVVGVPGLCYKVEGGNVNNPPVQIMTPSSPERISQYLGNTGIYTNQPYNYAIVAGRVFSTLGPLASGAPIAFQVCYWKRELAAAIIVNNGDMYLPDTLMDMVVAGMVSQFLIEEEYMAMSSFYRDYFNRCAEAISRGSTSIPGMPSLMAMGAIK